MKKIKLTKGKFAIVDDEDFLLLNRFSWQYQILKENESVYTEIKGAGQKKIKMLMHNMITPSEFGKYIHHKDKNGS
jgi:hypothetical protein